MTRISTPEDDTRESRSRAPRVRHPDNGGGMKGSTKRATLEALGIAPSFSRPRASNDNPYADALSRAGKYRPEYPTKPFADGAAAQAWVLRLVRWCKEDHPQGGVRFATPEQRHRGEAGGDAPQHALRAKVARRHHEDGTPIHSLPTPLAKLATIVRNRCCTSAKANAPAFSVTTQSNPRQARAMAFIDALAMQAGRGTEILSQCLERPKENVVCPEHEWV